MRLVHLSDLHFGREQSVVVDALLKALDQLQPELVLISGDLTQRATRREYRKVQAFLASLQWPVVLVPGNHDLSAHRLLERFFQPWKKWHKYIGTPLEPRLQAGTVSVAGINSARRLGKFFDWSRGRISPLQAYQASQWLAQTPEQNLRILLAHHPFWLPASSLDRHLIGGGQQALQQLAAAQVDIILGGHIHLEYVQLHEGIIISHAGTTVSDRLVDGQPNSFNLINGDRSELVLTQYIFEQGRFWPELAKKFQREDDGWKAGV